MLGCKSKAIMSSQIVQLLAFNWDDENFVILGESDRLLPLALCGYFFNKDNIMITIIQANQQTDAEVAIILSSMQITSLEFGNEKRKACSELLDYQPINLLPKHSKHILKSKTGPKKETENYFITTSERNE